MFNVNVGDRRVPVPMETGTVWPATAGSEAIAEGRTNCTREVLASMGNTEAGVTAVLPAAIHIVFAEGRAGAAPARSQTINVIMSPPCASAVGLTAKVVPTGPESS